MASQNAPLPPKRTKFIKVVDNEWKTALIDSFEGFNASQVSQTHVDKAGDCIRSGGTRDERYRLVPFERILNENQQLGKPDYLTSMTSAYDLLLKFVINLLKPNRPPVWRSIKTNNTAFKARVACMKGYEDILRTAGYTERDENSLQFPDHVQEPDKTKLYVIAAELLMARLEVDQMNRATQNKQEEPHRDVGPYQSPPRPVRPHTTMVTGANGSGTSVYNQLQAGGSQQGRQSFGYFDEASQQQQPNVPQHAAVVSKYDVGGASPPPQFKQEQQEKREEQIKKHKERLSQLGNLSHGETPTEFDQQHGEESWHRSQSDENILPKRASATVNLGSPAEIARGQINRPVPKPRHRKNPLDRSLSQQSSQGSLSSLSSTTPSSPGSPAVPSDGDEFCLPTGGPKKSVGFATGLTCISEEGMGEEPEDPFLRSLRSRRMAAKTGTKNVTVAATVESASKRGDHNDKPRPYTTAHAVRHDTEPNIQPPSLSSLRQQLPPSREEPLQRATPSGRGEVLTTPTRAREGYTSPIPSGRSEGGSDDSSSEHYSTPPTTITHDVEIVNSQDEEAPPPPKIAWATGASGGDNTLATRDDRSGSDDNDDHDAVLRELQRRRRELQQQREMSGKKKDVSAPTTVESETKPGGGGTKISMLPDSMSPPIQPSPGADSGYTNEMGGASRQGTSDLTSGIYCSSCHNKIRLGQKYCNYCNHSVYPMNISPAGGSGQSNKPHGAAESVDMSTPVRPKPVDRFKPDYQPDPNAPALPPRPAERRKIVNEPPSSFFEPSGFPMKAVAAEDKRRSPPQQRQQQPLRARVEDATAYRQHYDPFAHVTPTTTVTASPGAGSQSLTPSMSSAATSATASYFSQDPHKKLVNEYGSGAEPGPSHGSGASVSMSSSSGATGSSPKPLRSGLAQYSYKLEKYREHLQWKGRSDSEIERDPEYLKMVEEERHKQQLQPSKQEQDSQRVHEKKPPMDEQQAPMSSDKKKAAARAGKPVDVSKYERKNLIDPDMTYSFDGMENIRAMEMLKSEGQQLLNAIKMCVPFGYSLEEVQIASDFVREKRQTKARNPLQFLDTDWAQMTRRVQDWVAGTHSERRPFVGRPTEEETRKALVESHGSDRDAVDIIYRDRKEKIKSLLQRFHDMRQIREDIPELSWKSAVDVLMVNGMDVNKACYAVQCEWLQPLYESINSEHKKLKQDEMEEIKVIVSRKDDKFSKEARCRMLMAECDFEEQCRAQIVLDLMEQIEGEEEKEKYPLNYYVDAAHDFENLEAASDFLFKDCPIQGICAGEKIPIHEMITMPGCTCSLCKECFKYHFEVVIQEKQVKHFNCPMCEKPDMSNKDDTQGLYEMMFVSMIKEHLDGKIYELCQEKLKEFNLTKDPEFLWCAHDKCGSGFIYEGDRMRPRGIQCPSCKNMMCWKCKKPWEPQHDGLSCERFAQWKRDNDPEAQELGLAAHLNDNGIECPACHARYELARGGCMHFKCTKCPNEFCSGCGESMKKGKECGKYNSCATKGLHAHHPRDCLFFLRDFPAEILQEFLKENKMKFDTEAPKEQIDAARREKREKKDKKAKRKEGESESESEGEDEEEIADEEPKEQADDDEVELHCRVEEQKEALDGLKDEMCGKLVEKGHAGLCNVHYKEYLVNIINQNGLDPVTIYEVNQIRAMLAREEMEIPEKEDDEEDDQYRDRLIQHVQARLNLTGGRKAGEVQAQANAEEDANAGHLQGGALLQEAAA